ncbi:MAG: 3-methyl-2-oxobutanoate hydroxymethyltransferase [Proteobacteria bacterium]|nr:3-methyl-2-oxobutanoate hydroxymethyltransferase [Pseudomonadota bacterium]
MCVAKSKDKITVPIIVGKRTQKEPIKVLTAYDFRMSALLDSCGIDILLVGDSLGNVVYGFDSTLPVTMDMMIAHSAAVARGRERALVVSDLPFMSYQVSEEDAVMNAGRLVKEGGAEAVKLEGGVAMAGRIRRIVEADIPVMGHIGLRPQAVNMMGGYKVQGRSEQEEAILLEDASAAQEAGAFAIVIEGVPSATAARITEALSIPTIGIGAGPDCNGQVLVIDDLLGLSEFTPKFVRKFADLSKEIVSAVSNYGKAVDAGSFPSAEESFGADSQK